MKFLLVWWKKANAITKWLVGAIGLLSAILGIWQALPKENEREIDLFSKQKHGPTKVLVTAAYAADSQGRIQLSQSTIPKAHGDLGRLIAAPNVVISSNLVLDSPITIIANRLVFEGGSKIESPGGEVNLIAATLQSPSVDVSGQNGSSGDASNVHGTGGGQGGSIFVAVAESIGSQFVANGGNGGNGAQGAPGSNGRNGRCDGFGKWRSAQGGSQGGAGGNAGPGGDGGSIELHFRYGTLSGIANSGTAGKAATGGAGGKGGTGCTGLGGSQLNEANGLPGIAGLPAANGAPGVVGNRKISFRGIFEIYRSDRMLDRQKLDRLKLQIRQIHSISE